MKRLITIFVSSIIGISLWGQNLPVTVVGDVYIAADGKMMSEGNVYVQTLHGPSYQAGQYDAGNDQIGRVANYGTLKMDTVIFYSTSSSEGLLMNKDAGSVTLTGTSTPSQVIVRKNFPYPITTSGQNYYQMVFPFDVDLANGVYNADTGEKLTRYSEVSGSNGGKFDVHFYNAQLRANTGKKSSTVNDNWQSLDSINNISYADFKSASGITSTVLKKGVAYEVAVLPGISNLDFYAMNNGSTADLFATTPKTVDLTYTKSSARGTGTFVDSTLYKAEGWNAIGGLSTTDYMVQDSTVALSPNTTNVIYYRPQLDWLELYAGDTSEQAGVLRPYSVIFVQTGNATLQRGNTTAISGGVSYNGNGLTLYQIQADNVGSLPIFRSSASADYDLLKLEFGNSNNTPASKIYFKFNDQYNKTFNPSEGDAVRMQTTNATNPVIYSLAPSFVNGTNDNVAFVNCLPYNDNEVQLGVSVVTPGDYSFSLKDIIVANGINSAILWDKDTDTKTELLNSDYTYHSDGGQTESRFVLFINKSITSINQIATADIYAYAENNAITVKNLNDGDKVQVLDLTGRMIASGIAVGNTYSATVNQKGVYIVNAKNGQKVLKVLNK